MNMDGSVNLEWYRVFYHVARLSGISHASRDMHVSQPAISQIIRQLETKLETPLFIRTARGVRMTAEGELLFSYIQQAYRLIETAERKIEEQKNLLRGEVRIGAGDTLCRYFLLSYLQAFHTAYPDIHIHVTNRTSRETVKLLREGQIDFGIVHLPIEADLIHIEQVMTLHDCFVVGPPRQDLLLHPLGLSELSKQPLILLESGSVTRRHIDAYFAADGIVMTPEIELGSLDLLTEFAHIGLGVACVVREFIQAELEAGELFEVPVKIPVPPRQVGIIWIQDVPLSRAARQFVDIFFNSV